MTTFGKMTHEEQQDLIQKIGACLNDSGLGDTDISIATEQVCNLTGKTVEKYMTLTVNKDLPATEAEKAGKFNEAVKPLIEGIEGCTVKVQSKIGAGDPYSTITDVMPIKAFEKINLEHKEGEVWLVDFWATWCPPCQKPMAHNQEMLEKRAADWGSKVRIIGISIDQGKDVVVKHCEENKWMSVEHYHRHESKCSDVYSVSGVPHVMLIDTKGNIAFKGHPANREDLEKDFDALLRGETLTGKGCATAKEEPAQDEKAEMPKGFKELDSAVVSSEISSLYTVFEDFTKDEEMVKLSADMERAFCVLVLQIQFSPKTGKSIGKYDNYRVLVGPQDNINKIKSVFDEKVKGTFEVILQEKSKDKKNTCEKGHKLLLLTTTTYDAGYAMCNLCGDAITKAQIASGYYNCAECYDDYHKECTTIVEE